MKTTGESEEVQGWFLPLNLVRVKDAELVRRVVNNCKHQSHLWVLTSWMLPSSTVIIAIVLIGVAGLAMMPLAVIGMLALLRSGTAHGHTSSPEKGPVEVPLKAFDPNHAPE